MRRRSTALLASSVALGLTGAAPGQTAASYIGAAGGFWHVATNWQPNGIPDNNPGAIPPIYYNVTIDRNVLIDGGLFDVAGMTNSGALDTFTSWDFRAGDGNAFLLNTGSFSIIPTMTGGSAYVSVAASNTLNVSGGGLVLLGGGGVARILGPGTLNNVDNTIRGEGNLGEGVLTIINNGVIAATEASPGVAGRLNVFPNAGGLRNLNTLQARNLGTLSLRGTINNAGGTIVADDGGNVQMGLLTVTGGTVTSSAGGSILINGNTDWEGAISHTGNTVVNNDLSISGGITNTGSMTVNAALRVDTNADLAGAGTIFLAGGAINRVGPNDATLTTQNHIIGRGQIGNGTLTIINSTGGVIQAANGGSLVVSIADLMFNSGSIRADGGTIVLLGGELFNGMGNIHAANNSAVRIGGTEIVGGSISTAGTGSIAIPIANSATLRDVPVITGRVVTEAGGQLKVGGMIGNGVGTFDMFGTRLTILDSATLNMGSIMMRPGAQIDAGAGSFSEGAPVVYNHGIIRGAGTIGQNALSIINDGAIIGDGGGVGLSNALTIDPSPAGLFNSGAGVIEAVDLGVVILTGAGSGDFTQSGTGVMRATDAGSNLQIQSAYVSGGKLGAGAGTVSTSGVVTLQNLTSDANVFQLGAGVLQIVANVVNTGTINTVGSSTVLVNSAATLNSASGFHLNNGSIVINGGGFADFDFVESSQLGGGRITVQSNGQMMAYSLNQSSLTIQNNAFGTLKTSFAPGVDGSLVANLSIGTIGAALEVTDRGMAVNYSGASPLATIAAQITSGYAGGAWNGFGIRSSTAAANAGFGIGYAEAAAVGAPPVFLGRPIDASTVLFRYTRLGDANLDGTVNIGDFSLLAANFNTSNSLWSRGNFNYDGTTNIADFALLAGNFNLGVPAGRSRENVPEPSAAAWLSLLLRLRCRRRDF